MADKEKKDGLSCRATFNEQGQVTASLHRGSKIIATGQDFSSDNPIMDTIKGVSPLGKGWQGTGDSITKDNPGKYDATYGENGFKIDVDKGTCEVKTVDGGQQTKAVYRDVPLTLPHLGK